MVYYSDINPPMRVTKDGLFALSHDGDFERVDGLMVASDGGQAIAFYFRPINN